MGEFIRGRRFTKDDIVPEGIIPEPTIRRRFIAGWNNFQHRYRPAVHDWAVYDNSGNMPVLLEWGENP